MKLPSPSFAAENGQNPLLKESCGRSILHSRTVISDVASLPSVWKPPNTLLISSNGEEGEQQSGHHKLSFHDPVSFRQERQSQLDDVDSKDNSPLVGRHDGHWSRNKRSTYMACRRQGVKLNSSRDGKEEIDNVVEDKNGSHRKEGLQFTGYRESNTKASEEWRNGSRASEPMPNLVCHKYEHVSDEDTDKHHSHDQTYLVLQLSHSRLRHGVGNYRAKKQNQDGNATHRIFQKNNLFIKCTHRKYRYLSSRKKIKRQSILNSMRRSGRIRMLPFSLCSLNQNTNAQHSDTDLRDEGSREKKAENMSSASGASVVSTDIFYSTKTDILDECEVNPSMIELVGKSLADNELDSTDRFVKGEYQQEKNNLNTAMVDFGNVGDVEIKPQNGKHNSAKVHDQKIQHNMSGRKKGEDTQRYLLSKSPDEEARQHKKTHKVHNYACLFPSKVSPDKKVDGIDSVVLDCMRNALNEEIAQMEKMESTNKPPLMPENPHRAAGHRKRGVQDGSVAKSKPHNVKKGCLRGNKEDLAGGNEEFLNDCSSTQPLSKSAIVKMESTKEITPHRNLKSTSISTPNLPSTIEVINHSPVSTTPQFIDGKATSPKECAIDTASAPLADTHSVSNKRHDKSQPTHKRIPSNEVHEAIREWTAELDAETSNLVDMGIVLARKESLTDIDSLTLEGRDVGNDETFSETKAAVKSNAERGRSLRRKSPDAVAPKSDLASILSNFKDDDRSSETEAKTLSKEAENVKKKRPITKFKKSISLSPQGTSRSKREQSLFENHLSSGHGTIDNFPEKPKLKHSKTPAKKKRVRIAPIHDDSPVRRSLKPQNISPVQGFSKNVFSSNLKSKSPPTSTEEKENPAKKSGKKSSKKSASIPKVCHENIEDEAEEVKVQETNVQNCIYVPQPSDVPDDDYQSLLEVNTDENADTSPVHHSPSQTDISEKSNITAVAPKRAKNRKPEKELQTAETGWDSSIVQNTPKPTVEHAKSSKSKKYRKMYKLVKQSTKAKKGKEGKDVKGDTETSQQSLGDNVSYSSELSRSETGVDPKSSEPVASQTKKAFAWSGKKEQKFKDAQPSTDGMAKNHFSRRTNHSPKSNHIKQLRTHTSAMSDLGSSHEEQSNFGSSVDKREFDEGSSVDAPSFSKKDLALRQTRSGPALGLGKFAQKDIDNAAKRVKFARENAMNQAKQARKSVMNSSSPVHVNPTDTSPVKNDPAKFGQKANEEQMSPFPSMSTDLDLAAGFKRPRSSPLTSRYSRRDHKVIRSIPKLDIKVEQCTCAPVNVQPQSPRILPNCDNSVDYNVLNLGLNWMVQGVINRMPFLRPTTEHDCSGATAAGDTTNQQAVSTASLNR